MSVFVESIFGPKFKVIRFFIIFADFGKNERILGDLPVFDKDDITILDVSGDWVFAGSFFEEARKVDTFFIEFKFGTIW